MAVQKAMVLGMARSGIAAAKLLLLRGAEVWVCDTEEAARVSPARWTSWKRAGAHLLLGRRAPRGASRPGWMLLVVSPGDPGMEHPVVEAAQGAGRRGYRRDRVRLSRVQRACLLAVTGTNGKTTTVTLLGEIFKNAGRHDVTWSATSARPYSGAVPEMRAGDVTVCEVSSFMLETLQPKFHPAVSAVLNISEDHMNRHHTMARYIALKERIFENSGAGDFVVLNWDDPVTREMAQPREVPGSSGSLPARRCPIGAFVRDGERGVRHAGGTRIRSSAAPTRYTIPGEHNLRNALAATAMAMVAGIPAAGDSPHAAHLPGRGASASSSCASWTACASSTIPRAPTWTPRFRPCAP